MSTFRKIFCLNNDFSTTRLVTREKPRIENKPEDKFETILFLTVGEGRKGEGGLRTKGYFKKSFPDKPLISVITVVFNGAKYLEQTIQSVINQTYDNVEYIVIDGGSTDGTLDIIKKYENKIDYWVSEKDKGIYYAMNKGIRLSNGELIGIINSDDWYARNSINLIAHKYCSNKNIGLFHGVLDIYNKNNKYIQKRKGIDKPIIHLMATPFKHPTCFISKFTYKKIGIYNLKYKLASDYDLMLRLVKSKIPRIFIDKSIASLRKTGITTGSKHVSAENELLDILNKYTRTRLISWFFLLYRKLRKTIWL